MGDGEKPLGHEVAATIAELATGVGESADLEPSADVGAVTGAGARSPREVLVQLTSTSVWFAGHGVAVGRRQVGGRHRMGVEHSLLQPPGAYVDTRASTRATWASTTSGDHPAGSPDSACAHAIPVLADPSLTWTSGTSLSRRSVQTTGRARVRCPCLRPGRRW